MTSNGSQAALSDDRLQELAKRHLMMHFTRHSTFRNEDVPIITRGEGCYAVRQQGEALLRRAGRPVLHPDRLQLRRRAG